MELVNRNVLVTGGAGFIGNRLTDALLEANNTVTAVDDISNGSREWVPDGAEFIEADITNEMKVREIVNSDFDFVFHLAARKDPNDERPREQFAENTTMTHHLLKACREVGIDGFAYASSSTVYGEAPRPTPEDYAPLKPISVYGAAKLGEEGLVSTYAHSHGLNAWVFRFANVVGPRLRGAVIPDFIEKLSNDTKKLRILGDGRQEKSYIHVTDCINAMCHAIEYAPKAAPDRPLYTFNLGTQTTTSVNAIADIVSDVLDINPEYEYTGGERGWTGDVPRMRLSIEKIFALGWKPELQSTAAVRRAAEELAEELY